MRDLTIAPTIKFNKLKWELPYNRMFPVSIGVVYMVDEAVKYPCIVTEEQGGYLLAILRNNNQSKESYVELLVKEGHPLYDRVHGAAAMMNIAGPLQAVEGVGESYQAGVYSIYLDKAEHDIIIGDKA